MDLKITETYRKQLEEGKLPPYKRVPEEELPPVIGTNPVDELRRTSPDLTVFLS